MFKSATNYRAEVTVVLSIDSRLKGVNTQRCPNCKQWHFLRKYLRFRKQRQTQRGLTRKRQGCSNQIPKRQADSQVRRKVGWVRGEVMATLIMFASLPITPAHVVIISVRAGNTTHRFGIKRSVTRNLSLPKVDLMRSFDAHWLQVSVSEGLKFEIEEMNS